MQLDGKIGLITGGTTGIGFETAKHAFKQGAKAIAITGQNEDRLASARDALTPLGDVMAIRWRADQPDDTEHLAGMLKDKYGAIDFAFANAGVCWPTPLGDVDGSAAQSQMMVNFTGPLLLVQALVPLMTNGGAIVLTTSCLHQLGIPGYAVYSASKAALRSLARTLSAELKDRGIRVNTLAPGPFETPIHGKFGMDPAQLQDAKGHVAAMVPIGRFGQTDEIVDAAVFLASDGSRYMLGEEISVDGGWSNL
ncbi:MAG: SDR family oxidoreductase [Geminicoccales bacterium]